MYFTFPNVKISGISSTVPPKEKSLLDEPELYNGDKKKIERVINSSGFLKRRITEKDVMTSDLCLYAAKNLLNNLQVNKDEIDALLFISYTPDYLMPATSYMIHKKLKLSEDCIVMDIPQACSGYVLGLYQASMLINAGCKKVLLLVGDSFSKFTDMFQKNTAPVFGDAGTATLIEYDSNSKEIVFNINSDGTYYDAISCKNGGFKHPPTVDSFYSDNSYKYEAQMNGAKVFDFTMKKISPNIEELFKKSKITKDSIDYYVMHQANKVILENIARQLKISTDKMPMSTLTDFGNQCGASIPCVLSNILSNTLSSKENLLLLSGFGVGLSWASSIVSINKIYCSNMLEYTEEA